MTWVGVNSDSDPKRAARVAREHRLGFDSFWDGEEVEGPMARLWGVMAWPATFVIDQEGVIRAIDPDSGDLPRIIERLLAERAEESPKTQR